MRVATRRLALAGLVVLLLAGAGVWLAGSFLIGVTPRTVEVPADLGARAMTLALPDGHAVAASFMPGRSRGAVLLLHGIHGDRRDMVERARFLHARGHAVMLIDMPGQGASTADAVTFGLREGEGVRVALDALRRLAPGQRIGVIGVSLGAASFVLCRDCPPVDAVVLESMYPTIEEAVHDRLAMRIGPLDGPASTVLLWQLPLRLGIAPSDLHPIDRVAALRAPVLIAAGGADRHTTPAETERIHAAAAAPKSLWIVDGAGHVDLHAYAPAEYERRVGGFLAVYLGDDPPGR
jgi:pimeloyl-ACP methyl ester carboxylesterase